MIFRQKYRALVLGALILGVVTGRAQTPGSLHTVWGTGGVVTSVSNAAAMADAPGGGLYVGGSEAGSGTGRVGTLTKLTASGALDTSFGAGTGKVSLPFGTNAVFEPRTVTVQADGKVLFLGQYKTFLVVYRVTSAGTPDVTFTPSSDPLQYYTYVDIGFSGEAVAVMPIAGGGFVALGSYYDTNAPGRYSKLFKFAADGKQDLTFGTSGYVLIATRTSHYSVPTQRRALSLSLSGGSYQVWSSMPTSTPFISGVALDTISAAGVLGTPVEHGCPSNVAAINALQADAVGNMLMGCRTNDNKLLLARYLTGGVADTSFSGDGVVITDLQRTGRQVKLAGMWQRPSDGRVFVGGTFTGGTAAQSVFMACFRPDGTLDPAFGTAGVTTTALGFSTPLATAMKVMADGTLCLCGGNSSTSSGGFVIRYETGAATTWALPVIKSQPPATMTVKLGAPVTMSVAVQPGNPLTPGYKWKLGSKTVSTAATFTIAAAKLTDEGSYSVEVSNFAGFAAASHVALKVASPPVLTSPALANFSAPHGKTHDFTVTASGRQPMTFEWQFDGTSTKTETNSEGFSLLTVPVEYANDGQYKVIISNADGSITVGPATVKALKAPPATVNMPAPVYLTASDAGTGTLTLDVEGVGPFTFQWQRNGKNFGAPISGPDPFASLNIPALAANSGDYRCVVTGAEGSLITPTVPVRFYNTPTVRLDERPFLITTSGGTGIQADVYGWDGSATYQWQHNGVNIPGETFPTFGFASGTMAAGGAYRVIMKAGGHTSISNTINVPIMKYDDHRYVEAKAGGTVSLSLNTIGTGLLYRWYRLDNKPLIAPHCTGMNSATLKISNVDPVEDAVEYACDVSVVGGIWGPYKSGVMKVVMVTAKPAFDAVTVPGGTVGLEYTLNVHATNAQVDYTASGLPPGLTFDPLQHQVHGWPTTAGTWNVSFTASNPFGSATVGPFKLEVLPLPSTLAGTWSGPFTVNNGSFSICSGTITFSAAGTWTAKLRGTFDATSDATVSLAGRLTGPDLEHLHSEVEFIIPGTDQSITLGVWWASSTGMSAGVGAGTMVPHQNPWSANKHPATAYVGPYTVELAFVDDSSSTNGHGYATFTPRPDGTLTFAGKLPDGTAFAIPAFIDADGTVWLRTLLYGIEGVLENNITLSLGTAPDFLNSAVTGTLLWYRPGYTTNPVESVNSPYYYALETFLIVKGARYLPPGKGLLGSGALMMNAGTDTPNISVLLTGADLKATASEVATLTSTHSVTFPAFVPASEVKFNSMTFTAATGVFSGSFTHYVYDGMTGALKSSRLAPFQGVVVRDDPTLPSGRATGFHSFTETLDLHDASMPTKSYKVSVVHSGNVDVSRR